MAIAWRKCSVCKNDIPVNSTYQKCSVSNCRKSVFCSVTCWDVHRSVENHLRAWGEENQAPAHPEAEGDDKARRRIVVSTPNARTVANSSGEQIPQDVLVVVSKLKAYIKAKSDGMSTSDSVVEVLSQKMRDLCDDAIAHAREEGRKTVMDRDF